MEAPRGRAGEEGGIREGELLPLVYRGVRVQVHSRREQFDSLHLRDQGERQQAGWEQPEPGYTERGKPRVQEGEDGLWLAV